jgi:hypothetical protein
MLHTTRVSVSVQEDGFSLGAPGIPLEHYGGLREAFGCWYVTGILNREGFPEAGVGYAGVPGDQVLFLHYRWRVQPNALMTIGSGRELLRTRDLRSYHRGEQTLVTLPASSNEPGHYFLGFFHGDEGVVDDPDSGTIAAPPDPADLIHVPEPAVIRRAVASAGRCPRFGRVKDPLKTIRRDISNALFTTDGKRKGATRRVAPGRYSARVGKARATWTFWRISGACTVKGTITTDGISPRIRGIRAGRDGFEFDFMWRGADSVELAFGFGEVGRSTTAGRLAGPITYPLENPAGEAFGDGYLFAVFFRDGEVVGLEGGALPRLEDLGVSRS